MAAPTSYRKGDKLSGEETITDYNPDRRNLVSDGGIVRVRPGMRKALNETKPERLSMTQWVVTLLEWGMEAKGILPSDYRY